MPLTPVFLQDPGSSVPPHRRKQDPTGLLIQCCGQADSQVRARRMPETESPISTKKRFLQNCPSTLYSHGPLYNAGHLGFSHTAIN